MKSENELKVGDVIKSLDFINIDDTYFIGKVVSIDEEAGTFRAKSISRIFLGSTAKEFNEFFAAPLPGMMMLDDIGTRIEVLA